MHKLFKSIFIFIGKCSRFTLDDFFVLIARMINAINTGYYTLKMKRADWTISIEYPTRRIHGEQFISIGKYTVISKNAVITAFRKDKDPEIVIGDKVVIGDDCHITSINHIQIGNGTLLGKKVTITDNSHGNGSHIEFRIPPIERKTCSKGAVEIGENVWIGDKATICPGVKIGNGVIIGANSVVTKDLPQNCVAVGCPAKIIKQN